jgi:hypothetical protein
MPHSVARQAGAPVGLCVGTEPISGCHVCRNQGVPQSTSHNDTHSLVDLAPLLNPTGPRGTGPAASGSQLHGPPRPAEHLLGDRVCHAGRRCFQRLVAPAHAAGVSRCALARPPLWPASKGAGRKSVRPCMWEGAWAPLVRRNPNLPKINCCTARDLQAPKATASVMDRLTTLPTTGTVSGSATHPQLTHLTDEFPPSCRAPSATPPPPASARPVRARTRPCLTRAARGLPRFSPAAAAAGGDCCPDTCHAGPALAAGLSACASFNCLDPNANVTADVVPPIVKAPASTTVACGDALPTLQVCPL